MPASSGDEFVLSGGDDSDSDYEESSSSARRKKKNSLAGAKPAKQPRPPKVPKQVREADLAPTVKRSRKANEDLSDEDIQARFFECFQDRSEWTKKNLRLAMGVQLWRFQKFLDDLCDLDEEEGKYYTLRVAMPEQQQQQQEEEEE
ncbi:hypothetical protein BASA81_005883 [Batrachochytrium salamandrivorans]|nr:hypothetical protein BASA81_005883 [Batrachochytrium salamandrivorans]